MCKRYTKLFFVFTVFMLTSCASTRMSDDSINSYFKKKDYNSTIKLLEEGLAKQRGKNDELLYLLDLGLVLHTAKRYDESTKYFLEAEKIAEIQDYTNLGKETASILTSQNQVQYKGEDFEKVLINAYLALNFSLQSQYESALVEARKMDSLLYRLIQEAGRKYTHSVFARYLSGILYESMGDPDNAYIAYKKTFELKPGFFELGLDLYRTAFRAKRPEDLEKWKSEFNLSEEQMAQQKQYALKNQKKGELIVFFQNGWSPEKKPNPSFVRIPKFYPRYNPVSNAQVSVNGEFAAETYTLESIESTAIQNLKENYGGIIAKRVAGVVAKEAAGVAVAKATDSPELGMLTAVLLHLSDQADLRSWVLLPKEIQIARIMLEPGEYEVLVEPQGSGGESAISEKVSIQPRKKTFINFRYFP